MSFKLVMNKYGAASKLNRAGVFCSTAHRRATGGWILKRPLMHIVLSNIRLDGGLHGTWSCNYNVAGTLAVDLRATHSVSEVSADSD